MPRQSAKELQWKTALDTYWRMLYEETKTVQEELILGENTSKIFLGSADRVMRMLDDLSKELQNPQQFTN